MLESVLFIDHKGILNLHCKKARQRYFPAVRTATCPNPPVNHDNMFTAPALTPHRPVFLYFFPGVRFLHGIASQRGIWRELRSRSVRRRGNFSLARKSGRCAGASCASRKTLNTLDIFYSIKNPHYIVTCKSFYFTFQLKSIKSVRKSFSFTYQFRNIKSKCKSFYCSYQFKGIKSKCKSEYLKV
jgi:hypothetical protein